MIRDIAFDRDMGISHGEFFRTLPAALGDWPFQVERTRVTVGEGGRGGIIELGPQRERRIASLSLPATRVSFRFSGLSEDEVGRLMQRFDLYFQRGGG